MVLVKGRLTVQTKDSISESIAAIRDATNLLLKGGHCREASQILTLTGRACLGVGERHYGLERQEYILQVCVAVVWVQHVV